MSDPPTQDRAEPDATEPSMEDILSSIRRILSEESDADPEAAKDRDDVLHGEQEVRSGSFDVEEDASISEPASPDDLGDYSDATSPEADSLEPQLTDDAFEARNMVPTPAETLHAAVDVIELTRDMRVDGVVSKPTAGASADVLAQLAKAILDRRDIAVSTRDATLETMVREMLRPLLKEWLDRNLPYLIERLVRKEIDSMINRAERLED